MMFAPAASGVAPSAAAYSWMGAQLIAHNVGIAPTPPRRRRARPGGGG